VTLPGSATAVPSLDALKEWVQNGRPHAKGRLTTTALTTGGGNATGGLNQTTSTPGASVPRPELQPCHAATSGRSGIKDFTSPPTGTLIFTETNPPAPSPFNPVAGSTSINSCATSARSTWVCGTSRTDRPQHRRA